MNPIINSGRASLFEPDADGNGLKVSSRKQRCARQKNKDHSSFVVIPHIKKPNDKYTPLAELLAKAPIRQVAAMGVDVVSKLMNGNVGSALTAGAQGVMGLSTGDPSENTAESADVSTHSSDSGLAAFFSNNEMARPFEFRLKHMTHVIRSYINGQDTGAQLAWEFGKVGLIVGGALAALGISIVTAGGFDDLLRAVAIPVLIFKSLTSFSVPTLIQSLTAATPLACSFLSAAHLIADKLMQLDQAKELGEDTRALTSNMESLSKDKLRVVRAELDRTVEAVFQQHHDALRKNSVDEVAKSAFLSTYRKHWAHFVHTDVVRAKAVRVKINSLLAENPAIKRKAHNLWEKLHCWHGLNGLIKTMSEKSSQSFNKEVIRSIPRSFRRYLAVDKQQLPYAAMIMRERLQEEVEKEIGVKLSRKTGQVFNAETRKEVELDEACIQEKLKSYQRRIFLGGYLAGHFSPARKVFPELWTASEQRVQKVVRRRCSGQVQSLAGFLMHMTVSQLVLIKQAARKKADKNVQVEDMEQLKAILKNQLGFLEKTMGLYEGAC